MTYNLNRLREVGKEHTTWTRRLKEKANRTLATLSDLNKSTWGIDLMAARRAYEDTMTAPQETTRKEALLRISGLPYEGAPPVGMNHKDGATGHRTHGGQYAWGEFYGPQLGRKIDARHPTRAHRVVLRAGEPWNAALTHKSPPLNLASAAHAATRQESMEREFYQSSMQRT
ncbi:hypothetical protein BDY21DRAFT_367337 [Lineolata rhizophorae]|uniref:Uncharacterized protein n=1 Tax=Lineolata rhizophorae TaxID=578093 RepID=A0A6A6NMZ4_9PEZI|nr:hypothetical protein BDY21DRAFT_367337 [Lineolata rhizophorae]